MIDLQWRFCGCSSFSMFFLFFFATFSVRFFRIQSITLLLSIFFDIEPVDDILDTIKCLYSRKILYLVNLDWRNCGAIASFMECRSIFNLCNRKNHLIVILLQ